MENSLLEGVRVLDLSQYIPGPYASKLMAEQGAEVLKVEAPGGDPMRQLGVLPGEVSPVYEALNHAKKIIELDLKSLSGRDKFNQLLKQTDVLIEGFRPGTLARLAYSGEALKGINPALIICHLSGFGQTGDDALRAGHDLGYCARAGLYSQVTEHKPAISFPPIADHAAALQALAMISAALYRREKTGQGATLDISICGTVSGWQYLFESSSLCRQLSGSLACYNIYQCSDGLYVSLAALEQKFWQAFCIAVEKTEWIARQPESLPQRSLIAELGELFSTRTQAQWQQALAQIDCCFEVIPDVESIIEHLEKH